VLTGYWGRTLRGGGPDLRGPRPASSVVGLGPGAARGNGPWSAGSRGACSRRPRIRGRIHAEAELDAPPARHSPAHAADSIYGVANPARKFLVWPQTGRASAAGLNGRPGKPLENQNTGRPGNANVYGVSLSGESIDFTNVNGLNCRRPAALPSSGQPVPRVATRIGEPIQWNVWSGRGSASARFNNSRSARKAKLNCNG
jgi:hypothetical protein